jgi:hypothetical protein
VIGNYNVEDVLAMQEKYIDATLIKKENHLNQL